MRIQSPAPAWPPADLSLPQQIPAWFDKVKLTSENVNLAHKSASIARRGDFVAVLVMFVLVAFFNVPALWVFGGALVYFAVSTGVDGVRIRRMRPTKAEKERTKKVWTALYDTFHSNSLANTVLLDAVLSAEVNLYDEPVEVVVDRVKKNAQTSLRIGQKNCSQGHSALCVHRIPGEIGQWISHTETP